MDKERNPDRLGEDKMNKECKMSKNDKHEKAESPSKEAMEEKLYARFKARKKSRGGGRK